MQRQATQSGLSETSVTTTTKTTRDVSVCIGCTFRMTDSGGNVYPPGGGEISKEISGKGGAPLLSGATLSECVTDII